MKARADKADLAPGETAYISETRFNIPRAGKVSTSLSAPDRAETPHSDDLAQSKKGVARMVAPRQAFC